MLRFSSHFKCVSVMSPWPPGRMAISSGLPRPPRMFAMNSSLVQTCPGCGRYRGTFRQASPVAFVCLWAAECRNRMARRQFGPDGKSEVPVISLRSILPSLFLSKRMTASQTATDRPGCPRHRRASRRMRTGCFYRRSGWIWFRGRSRNEPFLRAGFHVVTADTAVPRTTSSVPSLCSQIIGVDQPLR